MEAFSLEDKAFIELNKLLKIMGLVGTGGEAKIAIENGEVRVNSSVETQRRKKLKSGDIVLFREQKITVQ
jgi:ribosome-associated protein